MMPVYKPRLRGRKKRLPIHNRRLPSQIDAHFIEGVMRMWDLGVDTYDIAITLSETEAAVSRALHAGREARRAAQ